ncbi:hypothetical protein [Dehalococcoides mccartyi]|uniref:WapI family immunity protein n=1 Tax=Dehalococcoides mccartyi TaxID=61435 RepID=UPI0026F09FCA|nr:hypothetical protein [Dehalococcoides mccartyi]
MQNELRVDLGGTIFHFFFSDKGYDDGGYSWTDACISVENRYFKYNTGSSFLTFAEIKDICESLSALLEDRIPEKCNLEFIEPDLQLLLIPKEDLRDNPKYTYIREGFEIEDISAEFSFYMSLGDGYTDERYTLPLYRDERENHRFFLNNEEDEQECIFAMTPFATLFAIFAGFASMMRTAPQNTVPKAEMRILVMV